jgi:RHS repeat-associated protein
MHNTSGDVVWSADLNSYGQVLKLRGKAEDCPFRYPGQYEDVETGLYYNRFRYYDAKEGIYLSQDPIGLWGGFSLYSYVFDTNIWVDLLGLTGCAPSSKIIHASDKQIQKKFKHAPDFGITGNFSKSNRVKFMSAINQHINAA